MLSKCVELFQRGTADNCYEDTRLKKMCKIMIKKSQNCRQQCTNEEITSFQNVIERMKNLLSKVRINVKKPEHLDFD